MLTWVPFGVIALSAPFEFWRYHSSLSRRIPTNWYNVLKLALTVGLVATAIVDIVLGLGLIDYKDDSGITGPLQFGTSDSDFGTGYRKEVMLVNTRGAR